MHSTMQHEQLTLARLLCHGTTVHGRANAGTWQGERFETLTYRELGARCGQLAHALRTLGVRTDPGDEQSVVATMMWNTHRHLEMFWTAPAMGAVLHPLNPKMGHTQLVHAIDDAADEVIVVDAELLHILHRLLPLTAGTVRHIVVAGTSPHSAAGWQPPAGWSGEVHDYEELLHRSDPGYAWDEERDEHTAAVVCYTSGTTGAPKGVVYSHRSIYLHALQMAAADRYHLSAREKLLPLAPMFHVNGWGLPHGALLSGAGLLLPGRHVTAKAVARMIEQGRPTLSAAVPTVWISVLAELDTGRYDVSSLRRVIVGGAACPPSLLAAYRDRHSVQLLHAWGMTETSSLATLAVPPPPADEADAEETEWQRRTTQGQLPASIRYRLVDREGRPVPCDGVSTGELELRGPCITGSYHGGRGRDPQRPLDSFRSDGWMRTGDVVSITPDGYLRLTDRTKDVIKSGGEFISSVELENALMSHQAVHEAAVIAVPDSHWGERPLAVLALHHSTRTPLEDLRDHLKEQVDGWKVPERWAVVDTVPKTAVGKFDKQELRDRLARGALPTVTVHRSRPVAERVTPIGI
ncbi:long-chain-fatty-acid--CoA ligase [Streptomyces buecherae]|uniref:Long-chain-fatty-acid--CoA ligase n=1 Tax=Streptomyces buecherae TaxID=2763006 RepID=A0A7H8N6H2_9ACTN|nr:long-chain-fatty-acid--CoA ligase [Streptomyces buecherae]QKW49926.1 long-chain-fatty-acid--CoA ligase [Streptomyces buecherae]